MTTVAPPNHHPARYSAEVVSALAVELHGCPHAHDPFAGTGERLGRLCDELGIPFSGTEIERDFVRDERVGFGDSRLRWTYPDGWCDDLADICVTCSARRPYWIVTSPVYANGMCDNFKPSGICSTCQGLGSTVDRLTPMHGTGPVYVACEPCNGTGQRKVDRKTYRTALMTASGDPDATLAEGNMGAHGYRAGLKAKGRYWDIAHAVIDQWRHAERALVNVSDFYLGPERVPHVDEWCDALERAGWTIERTVPIETKRMRNGANRGRRVEAEVLIVAVRA